MSRSTAVQVLAEEVVQTDGPPSWLWGVGAFVILIGLLLATWAFGRGRPHA